VLLSEKMNFNFQGKRVLVTGAGKGIGRDLVKALVAAGAETFALSRTESDLVSLKNDLPTITTIVCDLMDRDATEKAVSSCGAIDLLVNNAAIAICEPFLEITPSSFQKHFRINVEATIQVSQIIARGMIEKKSGGSIVNVSSQASIVGLADHTVYGASKAAIDQITRTMSLELGKHNIRVTAVNPTVVNTAMAKVGWSDPVKAGAMKAQIPLGRFAEVSEVVSVIMFLLSPASAMVSGSCIPIDGGCLGSLAL